MKGISKDREKSLKILVNLTDFSVNFGEVSDVNCIFYPRIEREILRKKFSQI